jgi:hypothetical protein
MNARNVPQRSFIAQSLGAAAGALLAARHRLDMRGWLEGAEAASADVLHETYNALLAFVAPGWDEYSIQQPVTTVEPGPVETGAADALIATIDSAAPYVPNFSTFLAAILNNIALGVNGDATGPFISPFARLSAQEKAWVFQFMNTDDALKLISDVLPGLVAISACSEPYFGGDATYFTTTVTSCEVNSPPS